MYCLALQLEEDLIPLHPFISPQGLSTLPTSLRGGNEPVSSVVQALKLIHDLFVFFYHSPDMVKKVCVCVCVWEMCVLCALCVFADIPDTVEM